MDWGVICICGVRSCAMHWRMAHGSYPIRTLTPWICWMEETVCNSAPSCMLCYFPESELGCPHDTSLASSSNSRLIRNITRGPGNISNECPPMTIIIMYVRWWSQQYSHDNQHPRISVEPRVAAGANRTSRTTYVKGVSGRFASSE